MLRKSLGEDSSSPIDIFSIINSIENLTLFFYPFSERISGICIRIDDGDSLIAINSKSTYGRQRFTAAHELYHLCFQENLHNYICAVDLERVKDVEERNADAFASYFLAPYEALHMYINENLRKGKKNQLVVSDIVKIEQHFQMSRQATLYRLKGEEYITEEIANSLKSDVIKSASKLGYSNRLYLPMPLKNDYYTLGSYVEMAEILLKKGAISQGKYEELLLDAYRYDIVYNMNEDGAEIHD